MEIPFVVDIERLSMTIQCWQQSAPIARRKFRTALGVSRSHHVLLFSDSKLEV